MKKHFTILAIFLIGQLITATAQELVDQTKVSQGLFEKIEADHADYISFCISLKDQVDVRSLDAEFYKQNYTLEQRSSTLIPLLKQKADQTQPAIIELVLRFQRSIYQTVNTP